MIIEAIIKASKRENLSFAMTKEVLTEIADGKASEAQMAAFLTAMSMKGETQDEITAAADVMRSRCLPVSLYAPHALDIVGTGGDCADTFNISTAAAFVLSAGGVPVAKHGSRSASGKTGAADVLEALGVNLFTTPEDEKEIFAKTNLCFMFAQTHHPAWKYVMPVRQSIKIRTFFNILGPLANPARVSMQILGVFKPELVQLMAEALARLGIQNGMVVHGHDGLDEASISTDTMICEIRDGKLSSYTLHPADVGLNTYDLSHIQSKDLADNVHTMKNILSGKEQGAKLDIVALNAALGLYIAKKVPSIEQGVVRAKDIITLGLAEQKLHEFIHATNTVHTAQLCKSA